MQRKIKKRNRDIESQSDRTSPSTRRVANDSAGLDPRLKFPKAPPRAGALGSLAPVQAPPRAGALGSLAPVQAPPRAGALGSLAPVQAPPRAGALGSLAPVQAPPLTPVPAPPPETPPPPRPPHAHKTRRIRARPAFLRGCWSGVLRERLSERCEEVGIRGCCCVEPAVLRWAELLRDGRWDRARRCRSCSGRRRTGVPPRLWAVGSRGYDWCRAARKMALRWSSPWIAAGNREELCLQYAEHTSRHGHRDSAGTDPATALPVAPQPGAALNRPRRCFSPDRHRRQPRRTPRSRWHYLGWRHRLFTEGLRQQFLFLTSQSSHTAARYWIPSSMPWKCLKIRNFKQDDVWNCAGSQLEVQK
ncbi:uncharacterized protein GJ701_006080 isoform 2-T8 [Geothlypis trichas]